MLLYYNKIESVKEFGLMKQKNLTDDDIEYILKSVPEIQQMLVNRAYITKLSKNDEIRKESESNLKNGKGKYISIAYFNIWKLYPKRDRLEDEEVDTFDQELSELIDSINNKINKEKNLKIDIDGDWDTGYIDLSLYKIKRKK